MEGDYTGGITGVSGGESDFIFKGKINFFYMI